MPSINIENAQIKTASIEIKALMINGRQLTLSTFRQIPEEDLINYETMTLNGIPWGIVNYFWKDNGCEESHLHIIWQREKELRRFLIRKKYENIIIEDGYIESHCRIEIYPRYLANIAYNLNKLRSDINYMKNVSGDVLHDNCYSIKNVENKIEQLNRELKNKISIQSEALKGSIKLTQYAREESSQEKINEIKEKINLAEIELIKSHKKINEYESIYSGLSHTLNEKVLSLQKICLSFNDLPQLFIAI